MELLKTYEWKGNVRELKNVVERTCILTPDRTVTADDLSFLRSHKKLEQPSTPVVNTNNAAPVRLEGNLSLHEMERKHIIAVLGMVNGHKGKAARLLEINPKTLYLKMKTYNIISVYE
jgi:DNA-binding NtrC family response regulator